MMKDCAERTFHTMEPRRQAVYHNRYGEWYKTHGQYLHALKFYCLAKNYDAALRVIQCDAGILLTSLARSRCSTSSPTARSKRSRSTRFRSSF